MTSRYCYLRSLSPSFQFYKIELISKLNKSIFFDFSNSILNHISFKFFLLHISNTIHQTQIRRRCVITGRSRSVDSNTSFSRFVIKRRIVTGSLTGFKKSS